MSSSWGEAKCGKHLFKKDKLVRAFDAGLELERPIKGTHEARVIHNESPN